jgi:Domain of unknown function (DUF5658)
MNRVNRIAAHASLERRDRAERRRRVWWAVVYGSFNPRRRAAPRRLDEARYQSVDWHSSHLLAVAIGILLLSVVDAFLTLTLLQGGAEEVNPVMALFVYRSVAVFASLKMALTCFGVVFMVFLARYRFMRRLPVGWALYAILIAYTGLIGYEIHLLQSSSELPIL